VSEEDLARLEAEMVEIAARRGMRFVGPNCIGVLNAHEHMNLTVCPYTDPPGRLGLISQSGTYVSQTMPYLRENGIRYAEEKTGYRLTLERRQLFAGILSDNLRKVAEKHGRK
jgi:acyl-CoA synthetase (NDP forming)